MGGFIVTYREAARHAGLKSSFRPLARPSVERSLDLTVALLALVALAPIIAVVAFAVLCERKGPVIFAHTRIGRGAHRFKTLKFRSMHSDGAMVLAEHLRTHPEATAEWLRNQKLRDDPRVTALGRFLRRSSLDELPQLLNVVRGEMSIVGPRPIVEGEVTRYGRRFRTYCSVRPGITGIWQVSGRSDNTYRRRIAMDTVYAKRKSIGLDLKLMAATIPAVLAKRGSY